MHIGVTQHCRVGGPRNNIHCYRLITIEGSASEKLELMASWRQTGPHPAAAAAAAADAATAHKVANVTQAHPSRVTES